MPASISVAMIVKDDAAWLGECLDALKGAVGQFCVVDLGSRDETRQVAFDRGADVGVFLWSDDLAAARNESLRMCESDWILILDADERIAADDMPKLAELADGPADVCYRFTTRSYTNTVSAEGFQPCEPGDPLAHGFKGWFPVTSVRLFPNHRDVQFRGKVLESLLPSIQSKGLHVSDCDITVLHYPLDETRKGQAGGRATAGPAAVGDGSAADYAAEGRRCLAKADYPNAAAALGKALELDRSNAEILKDYGSVLHMLKRSDEAKRHLKLALELAPHLWEAWRNLGVVYADERKWPMALECFERGLKLSPGWAEGHRYVSIALQGLGRLPEAAEAAQKALEANPQSGPCLQLFIHQMLRLERRADARGVLGKLVENGAGNPEIHNALGEFFYYDNLLDEAKPHFEKAGEAGIASAYNNLGVVYFVQRQYADAQTAFEKCLEIDPGHRGAKNNLDKVRNHLNGA